MPCPKIHNPKTALIVGAIIVAAGLMLIGYLFNLNIFDL